jgi:8-oxo-dGTP diphosphatase
MLELKEHQSARWLSSSEWESVEWLPADVEVIDALRMDKRK